jgi:Kef-type K+ transport systems, membrane components
MISFSSLLIVGAVAVAVPLFLGLVPAVKVPAVVLEILGGILVGPTVLGWVHLDVAVRVIADLGLGFLLFMAGFEIDLRRFDRRILILVSRAFLFPWCWLSWSPTGFSWAARSGTACSWGSFWWRRRSGCWCPFSMMRARPRQTSAV